MDKEHILKMTHAELYDAVKKAASTEAKLDMFLDFWWKVVMNDLHSLEREIAEMKKLQSKFLGILGAIVFIINIVAPHFTDWILSLLKSF